MLATIISDSVANNILLMLALIFVAYGLWFFCAWASLKWVSKKWQREFAKQVSELCLDNAKAEETFAINRTKLGFDTEKYQTVARLYSQEKEFWEGTLLQLNNKVRINWNEKIHQAKKLDKQWHNFGFKPRPRNWESNERHVQWACGMVSPLEATRPKANTLLSNQGGW